MKQTYRDKPWLMEISLLNFQTNAALIQCQGINGYNKEVIGERIWIVTRLHSPLGYPTDPIICGGDKGDCEKLMWQFRIECMPDHGPGYRGTRSKTKSGESFYENYISDMFKYATCFRTLKFLCSLSV